MMIFKIVILNPLNTQSYGSHSWRETYCGKPLFLFFLKKEIDKR